MIFVGSCNGFFRALNKKTGTLAWAYDTKQDGGPARFHGDPVVTPELVVVGSDRVRSEGGGYIYAFERTTGKLRWKYSAGDGVVTDIVQDASSIFAVTWADELVSLDLVTGRERWKFSSGVVNDDLLVNSSPALAAGRVFFGGMNGTVYALEARTGRAVWKRELGLRISTSIAARDESLYVGTIAGRLYMLSTGAGAILADYPLNAKADGTITVAGDSILVSLGDAAVVCLDRQLKTLKWLKETPKQWTTAKPYVIRGTAVLADDENVFGFKLSDGSEVWSHHSQGIVRGIGSEGIVFYVGTLKGMVYAYRSPFR